MRMMAVDYGDVRTGVAFCDVREMLATAYDTVEERYAPKLAEKLAALAKTEKAEQIVVGLPRNMDGSYGYRCDACRRLGDLLSELTGLPVVYQDERLTTVLAYDLLSAGNVHGKKKQEAGGRCVCQRDLAVLFGQSPLNRVLADREHRRCV